MAPAIRGDLACSCASLSSGASGSNPKPWADSQSDSVLISVDLCGISRPDPAPDRGSGSQHGLRDAPSHQVTHPDSCLSVAMACKPSLPPMGSDSPALVSPQFLALAAPQHLPLQPPSKLGELAAASSASASPASCESTGITFQTLPESPGSWERRFSRWALTRSATWKRCPRFAVVSSLPTAVLDTEDGHSWPEGRAEGQLEQGDLHIRHGPTSSRCRESQATHGNEHLKAAWSYMDGSMMPTASCWPPQTGPALASHLGWEQECCWRGVD